MRLTLNFLSILLFPLFTFAQLNQAELFYGIAKGNFLLGDLAGANRGLDQILRIQPDYKPALALRGRILLNQDRFEEAEVWIRNSLKKYPENAELILLDALAKGSSGNHVSALNSLRALREKCPKGSAELSKAENLLKLIDLDSNPGNWRAAILAYEALCRDDGSLSLTDSIASSNLKVDDSTTLNAPSKAIMSINQAIELQTKSDSEGSFERVLELRNMKALALAQIGQIEDAILELEALNRDQPENAEFAVTLASLYIQTDHWTNIESVLPPIEARPELSDIAYYLKGRAALAIDRVGTARNHFENSLNAIPEGPSRLRPSALFYQAVCFERLKRFEETDTAFGEAMAEGFQPETALGVVWAARILMRQNKPSIAVNLIEQNVHIPRIKENAEVWSLLGRAHAQTEKPLLAISAFNRSVSLAPENNLYRIQRGQVLRQVGDLDGAVFDLQSAALSAPSNGPLQFSLGLVYFQMGQLLQAKIALKKASSVLSNNSIRLMLALIELANQNISQARAELTSYGREKSISSNLTPTYLDYILRAYDSPEDAKVWLANKTSVPNAAIEIKKLEAYVSKTANRKEIVDFFGWAESEEKAASQISAITFWMAQHELLSDQSKVARELFSLSAQTGSSDQPEAILSRWILAKRFEAE